MWAPAILPAQVLPECSETTAGWIRRASAPGPDAPSLGCGLPGTPLEKIAPPDQGLDLAVGNRAFQHPEAAIGMDVANPPRAQHCLRALNGTGDLVRRF